MYLLYLTASRGVSELDKNLSDLTLQKPLSFDDMILVMKQLEEMQ